jgi:hypothetical protein
LIVAWIRGNATFTAGAGYMIQATAYNEAFEDGVDQSAGSVSPTFSEPSWGIAGQCLVAAFKSSSPSNPITVAVSGSLKLDTGVPVQGSLTLYQIATSTGAKTLLALLPISSTGTISGAVTFNAALQPLTIETDLNNLSGGQMWSMTMAGQPFDPLNSAMNTMMILMKSLNAQLVLSHTTDALISIQVTPTFSFP